MDENLLDPWSVLVVWSRILSHVSGSFRWFNCRILSFIFTPLDIPTDYVTISLDPESHGTHRDCAPFYLRITNPPLIHSDLIPSLPSVRTTTPLGRLDVQKLVKSQDRRIGLWLGRVKPTLERNMQCRFRPPRQTRLVPVPGNWAPTSLGLRPIPFPFYWPRRP